jgi:hypothetical protein
MNKIILSILFFTLLACSQLVAQGEKCSSATPGTGGFAWIEPAVPDVTDSVFLYVDLSKDPNCQKLLGNPGPLYIWTWSPRQPDDNLGTWNASKETARMQHVQDDIWVFRMIPTEFYGVEAEEVYKFGICFLAKGKDGGSGGDCSATGNEPKSTDVHVPVPKPLTAERKVLSFPDVIPGDTLLIRQNDVFTLYYNNRVENKPTLLNLTEAWVYFRVTGSDGKEYRKSTLFQVGNTPSLKMTNEGNGLFSLQVIPEDFMAGIVPAGVKIVNLKLQILRWPFNNTDDAVEGTFFFHYKCD